MSALTMTGARKKLALVWLLGGGLLFLVVLFQTVFGLYGERADRAWAWLLPTIMPSLSLVVAVLVADVKGKTFKIASVDPFVFRVAFWLSVVYLVVVALTIFLHPVSDMTPLELMEASSLWLGPLQGLVTAAIGAFFVVKGDAPEPATNG